jgi:hypothetical protein
MSQAKCAVGAECWQGRLLVCGKFRTCVPGEILDVSSFLAAAFFRHVNVGMYLGKYLDLSSFLAATFLIR